ncbi:hypothetical protein AVEN_225349-1 [Araneus ventricosus]|uniref:Uncharacterized protein n=1 Tax=Araneus ventricosus TaxID=182803 RepID=A0A4Y2ANW7_ARAVE|nr:hypothetical protein AVEN_225349-1 [Araneus ventricosus]
MSLHGKLAASSFHDDLEAFVNLLQACTLVMTNLCQACCKLKLLSGFTILHSIQNIEQDRKNIVQYLCANRMLETVALLAEGRFIKYGRGF